MKKKLDKKNEIMLFYIMIRCKHEKEGFCILEKDTKINPCIMQKCKNYQEENPVFLLDRVESKKTFKDR